MFGFFKDRKKSKKELTEREVSWNKMWDLWVQGEIPSPYNELMSYQSEVNNGGHDQYFLNIGNISDVDQTLSVLSEILPMKLKENLYTAYNAYLCLEKDEDDEKAQGVIESCDEVFFKNEQEITDILEKYCENADL